MIRAWNLRKRYRRVEALRGLDLDVPAGSIFGLIGPNGAGKSTCLRILAGLAAPTSGRVQVDGIEITHQPARLRRVVGYMPDHFGLYEDLTAAEYLEFYAAACDVPRARRRGVCRDLLALVGLSGKAGEFVNHLSLGMKQRLGLARCLVHDPHVLLLDEPAAGLDPRARMELRELLAELRRMGKTIVISSHILPELAEMCTHIGVIAGGRMVLSGPWERFRRPAGAARLEVEVLAEREAARMLLAAQPGVSQVDQEEDRLVAWYEGDEAALAEVLAGLVRAGVPVVSFARRRDGLEDLFMRLTEEGGEAP